MGAWEVQGNQEAEVEKLGGSGYLEGILMNKRMALTAYRIRRTGLNTKTLSTCFTLVQP